MGILETIYLIMAIIGITATTTIAVVQVVQRQDTVTGKVIDIAKLAFDAAEKYGGLIVSQGKPFSGEQKLSKALEYVRAMADKTGTRITRREEAAAVEYFRQRAQANGHYPNGHYPKAAH